MSRDWALTIIRLLMYTGLGVTTSHFMRLPNYSAAMWGLLAQTLAAGAMGLTVYHEMTREEKHEEPK